MKIKIVLLIVLLSVGILSCAQMSSYTYKRSLSQNTSTWHSIDLADELYSKVKADLSDIRIYGVTPQKDTFEASYFLDMPKESVLKNIDVQIINKSTSKEGSSYTFKLRNVEALNEISLFFKQQNFDWKIRLEGTQDQKQWFTLLDEYRILSILNNTDSYHFTTLHLGMSEYGYYRLTVKTKDQVDLVEASLSKQVAETKKYYTYPIIWQNLKEDKENKQSIIEFEIQNKVPISKIRFTISSTFDYYRQFRLEYLADSFKRETGWQYQYVSVSIGNMSSFDKNEFKSDEVIAKRFRLSIINHDDLPLKIDSIKVEGCRKKIIFRCTEKAEYWLVYGNKAAMTPQYDIDNFKSNIPNEIIALKVGDEDVNHLSNNMVELPMFMNKNVLWAVMILIILVLGGFSWKMLKNIR